MVRLKCHPLEIWGGLSRDLHLTNLTLPCLLSLPSISHSMLEVTEERRGNEYFLEEGVEEICPSIPFSLLLINTVFHSKVQLQVDTEFGKERNLPKFLTFSFKLRYYFL